jgi:glycosyltransferase involved in cell wall biosynthesis
MSKPFLIWVGAATDPSGYGEATRNYSLGMDDIGDFDMKLINRSFWHGDKLDLRSSIEQIESMVQKQIPKSYENGCITLFNLTPENYFLPKGFDTVVGMTTFETDSIPEHWGMPMRAMDAIITFSNFNKQTFEEFGINRPIHIVPHGVDVDKFHPGVQPMTSLAQHTKDKFVFGSNFDWSGRKNPEAILKAYFNAFTSKDDVVLLLKVYHQYPISESIRTIKDKIGAIKSEFKSRNDLPRILLFTDIIRPEDMPSFYTTIDCYVLPSKGEGWSLTHSEAMACGLPAIATGWGGNTEFMNEDNSFLLDYELHKISPKDIEHRPHYKGQSWAIPSIEDLTEKMKWIYNNAEAAKQIGLVARRDMETKWTWDVACNKLNALLKEMV